MSKSITFLGPRGTYTEEAALYLFGDRKDIALEPCRTIADCLYTVYEQQVDGCVVPMENSIEGSVNMTSDLLVHEVDVLIRAEITVPISHTLYVRQAFPLEQIEKIYSHPQAIAQCRHYLKQHFPHVEVVETKSTAEACQVIKEAEGKPYAAIGNALAKDLYRLTDVSTGIQDYAHNFTRFIFCGENIDLPPAEKKKTSLLVTLPEDYQGALYQVLAAFAWRKLNLSRIESRPTKKKLGTYYFFIDVDAGMDDVLLPGAMQEIQALGCQVRLLGSFPSYWHS